MRTAGFTLIEMTITIAIAAMVAYGVSSGVGALTAADLRSSAIELTGAIKMNYDRAVMLRRTQRMVMNIDTGTWWIDYTEDKFALSAERSSGDKGDNPDGDEDEDDEFDSIFDEDDDQQVRAAMEGGKAITFSKDDELVAGKPITLPRGVCFSRVWTGHQEDPFTSGLAYLHFFPGGWTEPAYIELVDRDCSDKESDGEDASKDDYITLEVLPLTGRARTRHKKMKTPEVDEWDSREQGDLQ